jgi:hypothetical protein
MNAQEEKKSEPEVKVVVKASSMWAAFWLAGVLFTVGFAPYPAGLTFWQQLGKWFLYLFVWPLLLGQKLAGN